MASLYSRVFPLLLTAFFILGGLLLYAGLLSPAAATYMIDLMYYIGISLAMAVIMSYTGYVSFGHTVFFGIGAFMTSLVMGVVYGKALMEGANPYPYFIMGTLLGILVAAGIAAGVGVVVLRLRGAFFAIATIGLDYTVLNLVKLYEGGFGGGEIHFFVSQSTEEKYLVFLIAFLISLGLAYYTRVSRIGYGLMAIREDEDAAEAAGVDTFRYKVLAFTISAVIASLWGAVIAWRDAGVVAESAFSLLNSVYMIVMNTIGGLGTMAGPIIGALIFYPLYRVLLTSIPQVALLPMGILVIIIVSLVPEGVVGVARRIYTPLRRHLY